jgi:hypothetical protein
VVVLLAILWMLRARETPFMGRLGTSFTTALLSKEKRSFSQFDGFEYALRIS